MEGTGGASVMNMTIKGSGTATGAEVTSGTLTVNTVTMTNVQTGMKVTGNGNATMVGGEIKGKGGTGTGVEMNTSGTVTLSGGVKVEGFETGLKVTGSGMRNTVTGGVIQGKRVGVEVSEKGILKVNGEATIEVTESNGVGLKVTGTGRANVVGGEIKGSGKGMGVDVSTSGIVTLNGGVKVMGFATGLKVTSGELKVMGGTTITVETGGTGLMVTGTGRANVVGGEIKGSGGTGTGVEMSGNGTVTLSGVTVEGFATGAKVEKGTLKMMGESTISLARGGKYGVYVGIDVTSAELTGTKIVGGGSGYGVYAMGGNVTLEGVKVSGVEKGVYARKGKSLTISGSSSIDFKGEYGVYVGSGVTAELKGTVIRGGGKGKGIHARGKKVTLEGVKVSGVEEGVVMMGSGTLTVERGTIELASGGKYGVYVGIDVTSASLTGTKIVGGGKGYGVYATGKKVTISGGEISKVITGVYMEKGVLKMERGTTISLARGGGIGVKVGDGVTSANLNDLTIMGEGKGVGVNILGGDVTMDGVRISRVGRGVYMEKGSGMVTVNNVTMTGVVGIDVKGSGTLKVNNGTIELAKGGSVWGVYVGGGVTSAELTGTKIVGEGSRKSGGDERIGVETESSGTVTLERVDISGVDIGVVATKGTLEIKGGAKIMVRLGGTGIKVGKDVDECEFE